MIEGKLIKTKLEVEADEYERKQGYHGILEALYEEEQKKSYDCARSYIAPCVAMAYIEGARPREKRIAELEAQIEKMKNWCNCKNYQQCLIELAEQGKGMKPSECCVNCKKWEIKENE